VCPQVSQGPYKVRRKAVQNQVNTGICRGCILPVFTWKYPACHLQFYAKLLLFCVERTFACWGRLWLFSIGSKQCFCPYKPYLLILKKKNAPHECGNPKCKVIALGWLWTNDSLAIIDISRLQNRKQDGARKLLASAAFGRTAPTGLCRARQRSFVTKAVVYNN